MELTNDFEVVAPIDQVWAVLNDVETIAPCLPGAQLQEIEGEEFRGVVKVKVGPITAQYRGKATFVERDDAAYRVVIRAEGQDTRGAGNASADITAQLEPVGTGTRVIVGTDLKVTGKVAQFGRGVMGDVSKKLMGQFSDNLSELIGSKSRVDEGEVTVATTNTTKTSSTSEPADEVRRIDSPEATPVDLLGTAGTSVLRRLVPIGVLLLVAFVIVVVVLY